LHTSKLPGSHNFELCLCFLDIQANFAKLAEASDLSNVSSKYHEFTSHHSYNLKINLEEGVQPPVGPIYSLLASE